MGRRSGHPGRARSYHGVWRVERAKLRDREERRVSEVGVWRRCSACKQDIALGATYWTCNVSTCNRKRTGLVFCSVTCWEVHLPGANHRESWAVECTAPRSAEEAAPRAEGGGARPARRRLVRSTGASGGGDAAPREVLIVASRLKDYIRARSGFNTSERVLGPLSDIVRRVCDEAVRNATREGRRTVLDRDIPDA
jgi:hypothetical protein